jgi:transcriptional regulator with XRE-family HTH domain
MQLPTQHRLSPQARGRQLATLGKQLYQDLGSVKSAAAELLNRHRDLPSIQAYRYAAGLSQDQAAARYNEVAEHQTSLGGTTINAWETWARGRTAGHSGSPPSFSSLLILATAYGRGPHGMAEENISPIDLVSEAYERLAPEDQLALRSFSDRQKVRAANHSGVAADALAPHTGLANLIGPDFNLPVPTIDNGNPEVCAFSLPNPRPGQLLDLSWTTFGFGVERLKRQIRSVGRRLDVDACFGINEAGLVMATFLASAQFGRCAIGYLKCNKTRDEISLDRDSFCPTTRDAPVLLICDFEVKHADVVGLISRELRARYPGAELYFAVFGAMTKGRDLEVGNFDELAGAKIMRAADFAAVFIAATMSPPGIEPPLELR